MVILDIKRFIKNGDLVYKYFDLELLKLVREFCSDIIENEL